MVLQDFRGNVRFRPFLHLRDRRSFFLLVQVVFRGRKRERSRHFMSLCVYICMTCMRLCILCGKTERDAFFFFLFFSRPGCNSLCRQIGNFFFQSLREETSSISSARAHAKAALSTTTKHDKTETHERARSCAAPPFPTTREKKTERRQKRRRRCRSWAVWRTTF